MEKRNRQRPDITDPLPSEYYLAVERILADFEKDPGNCTNYKELSSTLAALPFQHVSETEFDMRGAGQLAEPNLRELAIMHKKHCPYLRNHPKHDIIYKVKTGT